MITATGSRIGGRTQANTVLFTKVGTYVDESWLNRTFRLVERQSPGEVLVHDGGDVARVVREHHAVGADVLRARTQPAALAFRLRGAAA